MKRPGGRNPAPTEGSSDAAPKRRRRRARRPAGDAERTPPDPVNAPLGPRKSPPVRPHVEEPIAHREQGDSPEDSHAEPRERWGAEDDSPAPAISLTSEFSADAPPTDLDPVTFDLSSGSASSLLDDVANLVAVRTVPAGRISWYDAGDQIFAPGDRVVVDAERGRRLAWIVTAPRRKSVPNRSSVRRVLRRAEGRDLQPEETNDASQSHALRVAKDAAAALRLPLKVFRVELSSGKFLIYYTSDERLDLREFARHVSQALNTRVDPPSHSLDGSAARPGDPWKSPTGGRAVAIDLPPHSLDGSAARPGDPWKSPTGGRAAAIDLPPHSLDGSAARPGDPWKSPTGGRAAAIELRQLGGRDEAKLVGGIGSCGLTLCCSTWLPEFVPVSIKMAKDQGLALSPSKVTGQCGRLKCCLVYEQAAYAELRKGLPKLGKRVISARGEGRVVEVDVLTQRVRVSYGPGDTEMLPATDVAPKFPSGPQPSKPTGSGRREAATNRGGENDDLPDDDPSRNPDYPTDD